MACLLDDLKWRHAIAWSNFWKLEHIWRSQTVSITTKHRLFDSLITSAFLYGSDSWSVKQTVNCLINSFAISAYGIMTGFKRLSIVQNATDLASVSRQHLMQALRARQLKFLGHLIWLENSTCALCQPLQGNARRGRPRTNYIHYIHKLPGHDTDELLELVQDRDMTRSWQEVVIEWSDLQPPD